MINNAWGRTLHVPHRDGGQVVGHTPHLIVGQNCRGPCNTEGSLGQKLQYDYNKTIKLQRGSRCPVTCIWSGVQEEELLASHPK